MDPNNEELDIHTISRRSTNGVMALLSRQFVLYGISFAASIIISSFLQPKDLGIYAVVTAMQRVISFFTDFGLGAALVQKKQALVNEDLETTFTIQFLITLGIFVVVLSLTPWLSSFFKLDATGIHLLLAFVFTIFLSSFKLIPSILLERAIQFQKLVLPHIVEALVYNIILIVFVLQGFHLQAYVWAVLLSAISSLPLYYFISPWKISFGIRRSSLSHLHYGTQYQLKNILATLKDDLLTVFLAKFLSFTQLGYINFAEGFAFYIYRFITDSVTKVTFSTYARVQDNTSYLKKAVEKSLFFVSSAIFPLMAGLLLTGPYFIHYIPRWHARWEAAIVTLVFFSLNAHVSSLSNVLVTVLDASGNVKTTLRLMMFWVILNWFLTLFLIKIYGYNGVSIASFLVTLTIVITIYLVKRIVQFNFWYSIYKPAIASIGMVIFIIYLSHSFIKDVLTLFVSILLAGGVYCALLYIMAGKELKSDYKYIYKKT